MVYLIEALCLKTNEVFYGAITQPLNIYISRCRDPGTEPFGQRLQRYGVEGFRFRIIGTYTRQKPAIADGNKLITRAWNKDRGLNCHLLVISNRRNAKH